MSGVQVEVPLDAALEALVRQAISDALDGALASPWFNVAGVASYASMTPTAVRSAISRRQLKSYRSETGRIRVRRSDVDAFLTAGGSA